MRGLLARGHTMNNTFRIEYQLPPVTVGKDAQAPDDHYRIVLVRRGAVRLACLGRETIAAARSMALIHPHASVDMHAGAGAETAAASFAHSALDPAALGRDASGLLQLLGSPEAPSKGRESLFVARLAPDAFADADALLRRLGNEIAAKRPGCETMIKLTLIEMLMILYRSLVASGETRAAGAARFRIEDAVFYVEDRYSEELSLPDIARHFGLNPSYFSRLFARHTGMPLFSYVNRLRIQKSCMLLKRSGLSILEIAFSVGYNNLSHFNRYFRRIMGESPREYRKRAAK
jgi:AraC-like DNA-binding protein